MADNGKNAGDKQWLPSGVFSIISEGQANSDKLLQLAVNKDGIVGGSDQDSLAE
jgi:hypothetical protein